MMLRVGWVWTDGLGGGSGAGVPQDVDGPSYALAQVITASNTVDFIGVGPSRPFCDAIDIGGAGVVPVVWPDGAVSNFTCVVGQRLRVKAKRVNLTGCTATNLVALFHA